MSKPPRYVILGGEVFDKLAAAPSDIQGRFLIILSRLRRDPFDDPDLDIERPPLWGDGAALMAAYEGVDVSYYVVDSDAVPRVVLLEALWL